MKTRITIEDVNKLSPKQKQHLINLWIPQISHTAIVNICTNVETEEYHQIEFVIGEIIVDERHGTVMLKRLRFINEKLLNDIKTSYEMNISDTDKSEDSQSSEYEKYPLQDDIEIATEELFENIDYDDQGDFFNKLDCLPLLGIGQMIELLRKIKYGDEGFVIEVSHKNTVYNDLYILDGRITDIIKGDELADVLWEAIITIL